MAVRAEVEEEQEEEEEEEEERRRSRVLMMAVAVVLSAVARVAVMRLPTAFVGARPVITLVVSITCELTFVGTSCVHGVR